MSAKIAELMALIAATYATLGEQYTELSALYDVESAKGGKPGNNGAAGKVPGKSGKAGVAPSKAGGDDDELPAPTAAAGKGKAAGKAKAVTEDDVRAMAKEVIEKHGKEAAVEILSEFGNGKLADVDETDYAACLAKLQEKRDEEDGEDI